MNILFVAANQGNETAKIYSQKLEKQLKRK